MMAEKKKIKCDKCGYEWETKSKLILVSCPSCLTKVRTSQEAQKSPDGNINHTPDQ